MQPTPFERFALGALFLVGAISMVVSFVALTWLGGHMRLGWAAWLIPLTLDGFGVACSAGIVRSQSAGEQLRERASEWAGLTFALGVSVLGNVYHVLNTVPVWLKILVAASVPIIVAYSVHIYGRASVKARVAPAQPAPQSAPRPAPERAPRRAPQRAPLDGAKARARALYDEMRAPGEKPNAQAIHDAISALPGAPERSSTTRKWVAGWWDEDPHNLDNESAPTMRAV